MCGHVRASREVAAIKKQSTLAVEEAIKLLQSNDVIYTAVLYSLVNQTTFSTGRLSIGDYKRPSKREIMHLTGW